MTNIGKWAAWYQGSDEPWAYGDPTSYEIGAAWLAGCTLIEDWGCGAGWLRTLLPPDRYRGLDGTASPGCDAVVDLVTYRSHVPGVFMRHVLEHNHEWARILDNALASFTDRMVLILFTPGRAVTEVIACHPEVGVPDIAFRRFTAKEVPRDEAGWFTTAPTVLSFFVAPRPTSIASLREQNLGTCRRNWRRSMTW